MAGEPTADTTMDDTELQAFKEAFDAGDWDVTREKATEYVNNHPEHFADYQRKAERAADEAAAHTAHIATCGQLRLAGLDELYYRAEAFQLHRWHPLDVTGSTTPRLRNPDAGVQPKVRNHR